MAVGNAQFIKDIINDTDKSTRTTYSSDRIEALLGQTGASSTVYLVTVSDVAPATPAIHDKYYNTTTGLVYEFLDTNKWDNGTNPSRNTLYVDNEHNKMYIYKSGKFEECSGITKISQKQNNAVQELTGADEGLYVKDLSEEVKQINIAQKTVNELGYKSLLNSPSEIFTLNSSSSTSNGEGTNTILNKTITLNDSIENYNYLKFILEPKNDSKNINWIPFISEIRVSDINYHNSEVNTNSGSSTFIIIGGIDTPTAGSSMVGHVTFKCWFKDSTTLFVYRGGMTNTLGVDWSKWRIKDVIGISKEIITIDPVNYIDTNQGIEDTPVGQVITKIGLNAPAHYLLCDGSEYNIIDYPYLAQAIKEEFGSVNHYGGDGVTTFAVPNKLDKTYYDATPEFTMSTTVTSSKNSLGDTISVSASSEYGSGWTAGNAYSTSTAGRWASKYPPETTGGEWYKYEFSTPRRITKYELQNRKDTSGTPAGNDAYIQSFKKWKFQGSNDGTNWDTVHSVDGTSITFTAYNQSKIYTFNNAKEYKYYRFFIEECNQPSLCSMYTAYLYSQASLDEVDFIKYEPTYFVGSINGHEEVTELLSTPILIQSSANTGKQLNGIQYNLLKEIDTFDKIEIIFEYAGGNGTELYRAQTNIFRVQDIVYSDSNSHTSNNSENINCNFIADGSIAGASVMFNWCTNKKSIKLTDIWATGFNQNIYYRIKSIRGIRSIYAPDKALGSGTGSK